MEQPRYSKDEYYAIKAELREALVRCLDECEHVHQEMKHGDALKAAFAATRLEAASACVARSVGAIRRLMATADEG